MTALPTVNHISRSVLAGGDGGTEASFAVHHELPDGVSQEVRGEIEAAFQMAAPDIVAGLKRYTETGRGTTYDEIIDGRARD